MKFDIQDFLEKIDIVDLVSKYVKLKKMGRNFVGLCPFHKERSPSFTVSPEKQLFFCFGCHTGGNAITFMMKYENLEFHEAVETIAKEYGIPLTEWKGKSFTHHQGLKELLAFYHETLKRTEVALRYLKSRGIGDDVIDEFMIGFSSGNTNEFLSKTKVPKDVFFSAGIFKVSGGEIHDIFRGRVVIPIFDVNGKVVGFGGRAIEEGRLPKYINSPESAVFSKRSVLFGIEKAKKHIIEKNMAIVVEGYFDMISLFMSGVKNVVASLGTAITEEQIKKLKNYTRNITIMLDPDEAGIKSALRAIELFSTLDVNGEIVLLPEGYDPDSFTRKNGYDGVISLIEKRKPVLEYYFEFYRERYGMDTLQKKIAFIKTVMPHIEVISDGVLKRLLIKRLYELTGVEEHVFLSEVKKKQKKVETNEEKRLLPVGSRMLLGVIFNDPTLAYDSGLRDVVSDIKDETLKGLIERFFEKRIKGDPSELSIFLDETEGKNVKESIISAIFETQELDKEAKKKIIEDYIKHTRQAAIKEKLKNLTEKLAIAEREKDDKKIAQILLEKKETLEILKLN